MKIKIKHQEYDSNKEILLLEFEDSDQDAIAATIQKLTDDQPKLAKGITIEICRVKNEPPKTPIIDHMIAMDQVFKGGIDFKVYTDHKDAELAAMGVMMDWARFYGDEQKPKDIKSNTKKEPYDPAKAKEEFGEFLKEREANKIKKASIKAREAAEVSVEELRVKNVEVQITLLKNAMEKADKDKAQYQEQLSGILNYKAKEEEQINKPKEKIFFPCIRKLKNEEQGVLIVEFSSRYQGIIKFSEKDYYGSIGDLVVLQHKDWVDELYVPVIEYQVRAKEFLGEIFRLEVNINELGWKPVNMFGDYYSFQQEGFDSIYSVLEDKAKIRDYYYYELVETQFKIVKDNFSTLEKYNRWEEQQEIFLKKLIYNYESKLAQSKDTKVTLVKQT